MGSNPTAPVGVNVLYQVDIGYACFGVEVKHKIVIDAAPIGRWMIGKTWKDVRLWIENKDGNIVKCTTGS